MLDQEHHRAWIFAAHGKSLHNPQQGEPDRREHSDGLIARQQAHQKGRDCHGGYREHECSVATEPVADMADQHAADRPHQIADRKYAERRKQLGDRIVVRKEVATNLCWEITVDRKIVPFEHVADNSGRNHPACGRCAHLAPKAAPQREEFAPFQLIELQLPPEPGTAWQHTALAGSSPGAVRDFALTDDSMGAMADKAQMSTTSPLVP